MTSYRRARIPGGTYLFTVNLAERQRRLLVEHIESLKQALRAERRAHPFGIQRW